ncbi:MAG: nuclear transport factor 2 family protein [Pseudomonas sp.]|nr:nuclear transport factor 2 family protein [Pseudomonas sp.]
MAEFLYRFADTFSELDKDNLDRLSLIYSDDIHFRDPLHEVRGMAELRRYFGELYANVEQLHFDFEHIDQVREGEGYLRWCMTFAHPRLNKGQRIQVPGCSHVRWHDKVYQHRDYFDAGALLYEHVPVLGSAVSWLKRRMA